MKQTWQKGSALLMVGVMMISTLVALISAPVVMADEQVMLNNVTWTAEYDGANMINHPGIVGADEDLVINERGDGTANTLLYLGERDVTLQFDVQPSVANAGPNHTFTITISPAGGNNLISVDASNNDESLDNWPIEIGNFTTYRVDFQIDIGNKGIVEAPYEMICTVRNDNTSATTTFSFWVYVSSVFHDNSSETTRDDTHTFEFQGDMPLDNYIIDDSDGTPDAPLEAGDSFKKVTISNLTNHAGFTITNPRANLTPPNSGDITLFGADAAGMAYAQIMEDITGGSLVQDTDANPFQWRVSVAANTPPGVTQGDVVMSYDKDVAGLDELIVESTRPIDFSVDFSFADTNPVGDGNLYSEFQCRATSVTIVDDDLMATRQVDVVAPSDTIKQSTYTDTKILVNVTIENNGNTDLFNVEFKLAPEGWGSNAYFRNPRFFYHEGGNLDNDSISLTLQWFNVSAKINFTIEMIVLSNIPIGEHRLPIVYDGFYFNDGSLGGSTGFMGINGGNGTVDGTGNATDEIDGLEIIISIIVEDEAISCHVVVTDPGIWNAGGKNDIRANQISITIFNDEKYDFIDVIVRANFANTPWYNPIINANMSDTFVWANEANEAIPQKYWPAGEDFTVTFDVDTDPNMIPDRYPFELEITAVINETLQQVPVTIDYTRGAVIDFTGYGPQLLITAFTAEEIVPGGYFDLELTITNLGDDTARNVFVSLEPDDTEEYAWNETGGEKLFKEQFDWSGVFNEWGGSVDDNSWAESAGGVSWSNSEFPSEMFYTMESLDVDNIREIVEINLYMDGVYSTPGSTIMVIKINDLDPGQNFTVTFTMIADKDMVNGKPYAIPVTITGIDPDNGTGITTPLGTQTIEVMSSLPGESYNPVEVDWFDTGVKALALLLFLIIIIAILLMVFSRFKGDSDDYDDDDDEFGFEDDEDDYEPLEMESEEIPAAPMEAPAPPPEEQLVEP